MDLSARAARPTELQRRRRAFQGAELRAAPDGTGGDSLAFTGYASVTDEGYEMEDWLGSYTEVVRSGAFKKTLSEGADVPLYINHTGMTLARTKSGTMRLSEDDTGLYVEADLDPANPDVQRLRSAMSRGDLDEMSFGFWVTRQQWSPDYGQRDILEVSLNKGDVSIVNYGANPATSAQVNAASLARMTPAERRALHEGALEQMTADERRALYERLAGEFTPQPAAGLSLDEALGRLLDL